MPSIEKALALVQADAARIERFAERREKFLDALDWSMLTCSQVFESAMLDVMLDDDIAKARSHVRNAERLVQIGVVDIADIVRYAPHPRPWHPEWMALTN